ncbi:unnamed protein product [Ambrosiozyma monospora]|uniref:Unnamed protein product n=1 Tax=Ambrosiozyma monospora TaxID=43982 RepID=A0A9W6Z101_AMBMO|nr:unnamed protein product [Ambrosiozyma monospora]
MQELEQKKKKQSKEPMPNADGQDSDEEMDSKRRKKDQSVSPTNKKAKSEAVIFKSSQTQQIKSKHKSKRLTMPYHESMAFRALSPSQDDVKVIAGFDPQNTSDIPDSDHHASSLHHSNLTSMIANDFETPRNVSALFFSDSIDDAAIEQLYNDLPIKSSSTMATSSSSVSTSEEPELDQGTAETVVESAQTQDQDLTEKSDNVSSISMTNNEDDSSQLDSQFTTLNISAPDLDLDFVRPKEVYSNEIPDFYIPGKLQYPYHSPYEYSDEEFETLNHFDFLRALNFKEPPLLPPYLNSNLLNDSKTHNYKTYPYQYQYSNHIYINDQYKYNINDLNTMDKYSAHKPRKQRQSHRHHSASGPSTINSMNQQKSDNNTSNYKLTQLFK